MNEPIIDSVLKGNSVIVVGPSDAGKTFWVKHTLIPRIESFGKTVSYSKDGFNPINYSDIAVFDEAETLFDAEILGAKYPEDRPYYSERYLKQVADWHRMYAGHQEPSVYVISRRKEDEQYLVNHFDVSDWDGRKLKTFRFFPTS